MLPIRLWMLTCSPQAVINMGGVRAYRCGWREPPPYRPLDRATSAPQSSCYQTKTPRPGNYSGRYNEEAVDT